MDGFVWNDRFVTGLATVDTQHHHLVDIVNRVGEMLLDTQPTGKATIEAVFHELATYANTHFKDEEQLMQETGVSEKHFLHHVKSHRNFIEQVQAMWRTRTLMSAPAETLHGFLSAWLSFHILGEDMDMAHEINRLRGTAATGGSDAPPEAHDRSTDALLEALHNLYRVLSQLNRDLIHANSSLEEEVTERTRELTAANHQLQEESHELEELLRKVDETQSQLLQSEKMASIGQLAAGVAHEINNPIGFVTSNLGMLSRYGEQLLRLAELGAVTPAGQALKQEIDLDYLKTDLNDLLRETKDGLDRVRTIVANLKDFSHVDQAEWQDADLLAGLESTVNVASHEIKYKAEIVREFMPLPPVRCVPAQINQVFLNLLVNAAQAIPEHGTITLRSHADAEWVWIEIADSGCGMDETTQRRIFEPFFTTKPVGTGTGLGMSLTYDIVKKHGGSIDVSSTIGQGTTIRIWLPIAGPASAPTSA